MHPSVLLAFPLLLALSTPCSACHCKVQHPQAYYCSSEIVLLVEILGPGEITVVKRSYKVKILQIFKRPRQIPEIHAIYTPLRIEECGYQGEIPKQSQVLIAGFLRNKRVNFTKCHMMYFWNQLTPEQKIGFERKYRTGCKCSIQPCLICSIGCPQADRRDCVWKQTNCDYVRWTGSHSLTSACVPSTSGRCDWTQVQA